MKAAHFDIDIEVEQLPPAHQTLRLAVVTETYPPEVNGVAVTLHQLVTQLQARGHALQLIRPRQRGEQRSPEPDPAQLLTRGIPIPRYPNLRMGLPSKRALVRLWSWQRPDAVHIATEGPLGWSALQAASVLRLPVTSDFRTNFDVYSRHYGVGWLQAPVAAYLKKFHNRTAYTMVPTRELQAELLARGYRNVEVVMRGVDTQRFAPDWRDASLRQSWGAGAADPVVICVGRLAAEKNLMLLVRAMQSLRTRHPAAKLVLVGDGPLRAQLEAAGQGQAMVLAGEQRGESLARHYASADIFAFPSLTETFGNVVAEALASGLAVLAYDRAAATELIEHRVHGMKAACDNEAEFMTHLETLLDDPDLRAELGAAARQRALQLSWGSIAERFERITVAAIQGSAAQTATSQLAT